MTKNEKDKKIVAAYQDVIFKKTQKELFILLYEMRFTTKRIYHNDGRTTLELPVEMADRLEQIFQ